MNVICLWPRVDLVLIHLEYECCFSQLENNQERCLARPVEGITIHTGRRPIHHHVLPTTFISKSDRTKVYQTLLYSNSFFLYE